MLVLGRILGAFGVRGWVKVHSETRPGENILGLMPWYLGDPPMTYRPAEGRRQGKSLVVRLEGCTDRDQAVGLRGLEIRIRRNQLPPTDPDELYWADLEGLSVETIGGVPLGRVDRLFATGANDVVVVAGERERLIPFLWDQVIIEVNMERGLMRVDWDPDF